MMRRKLHSEKKFDARLEGDFRYCFGSKPPPPDPNLGLSSREMANVAREQLSFNRQVYEEGKPRQAKMDALAEQLVTQQMGMADESRGRATELWDRWKSDFAPIEGEFARIAERAGGAADQEQAASTAAADLAAAEAVAQGAQERNLRSMGVNPNSPRFAAATRGLSLASAANRAGVMTNARRSAVDRGLNLKASAINVGRGLPALGLNSDQLSLSGANSAAANSGLGNNLMMQRVAGLNQGFNSFQGNIGNAFDASMAQHQSAVNATAAKNQATGQVLGTAATIGTMAMMSDGRLKTIKRHVGELDNGVHVYAFEYLPDLQDELGRGEHIGVVAQELARVLPAAVFATDSGYLAVDYSKLQPVGWGRFAGKA